MADIRINALATTAATPASDDFLAIDGTINGTRKMSAATPAFFTSVTVPTIKSAAGSNLNVSVGTAASDIEVHNALTDATSSTAAGTTFAGGVAIAKKLNVGTEIAGATAVLSSTATAADYLIGTSGPSVKSSLAARAPAQGLVFDGTAPATWAGYTAGTGDLTAHLVFSAASVTTEQRLLSGPTNAFALGIKSSKIQVATENAALVGESSAILVAGKETAVTVVRASGTTTIYINGVSAGSFADTTDYSAATTTFGRFGASALFLFTGSIKSGPYLENRALSAAEVLSLYESGAPAAGDYNNASNTSQITGDASDFDTDNSYWTKVNAAIPGDGTAVLQDAGYIAVAAATLPRTYGKRYKIVIEVTGLTAGKIQVNTGNNAVDVPGATTTGTFTYEYTCDGAAPLAIGSVGGIATLSTVTHFALGLLLAPESNAPGNGLVWNDTSGNGAHIVLPSSGVAWALPSNAANRIRGTTNTNGNQQLLGASVLLPAESQILRIRARSQSGTPSITIGTASGGSQIVSSVALSTTWKNLTIALTDGIVSTADDIWIGSNSTDVVETDISWEPLNF